MDSATNCMKITLQNRFVKEKINKFEDKIGANARKFHWALFRLAEQLLRLIRKHQHASGRCKHPPSRQIHLYASLDTYICWNYIR